MMYKDQFSAQGGLALNAFLQYWYMHAYHMYNFSVFVCSGFSILYVN